MSQAIQFQCPACAQRLKLPALAAGQQGPCPKCGVEIVGPLPELGIAARLAGFGAPPLREIPLPVHRPPTRREPDPPAAREPEAPAPPPAQEPSPRPAPPSAACVEPPEPLRGIHRLWLAVLVLSCLLCIVLSFIGGYLTALKRLEADGPIFPQPSPKPVVAIDPPAAPPPVAPPSRPDPSPPLPDPEEPADSPDSLATLKAFLSAPDWAARSLYVVDPENTRPRMKAVAEEEGDGPTEAKSIEPAALDEDFHHYRVRTAAQPDGFPVTLVRGEAGWMIDWDAFHEFSTDRFGRFTAGDGGGTGDFRLLIRRAEDHSPAFATYRLTSPAGSQAALAFASRSGPVHAKLTALLGGDDPQRSRLRDQGGLPVIVTVHRKTNREGQAYLEVAELRATGWGGGR